MMENAAEKKEKIYRIGGITYKSLTQLLLACSAVMAARLALALVFGCLVPMLKPLLLDRAGANAAQIAIIIGTIPSILNAVLCPIISTISDKTRTRWGRRTPYLLFSAPVLGIILVLLGYTQELAGFLHAFFPSINGNLQLWILSVLIILFQIAFLFPGSVVYYLEIDIVPSECLGRYMAFASILTSAVTAAFGYFVTQYMDLHIKMVVWIFAILYVAVYLLQAIFAKEGEYPPVNDKLTENGGKIRHMVEYVAMFFRQFFSHKIFIALALCGGLNAASTVCRTMYNLLFATKEIGVSLEYFGEITAICGIASAVLVYFAGKLMDKTHPMLIYFLAMVLVIFTNIFGYFFVYGPKSYMVIAVITAIVYAFQNLAATPLLARIFPPDKFGQFCSGDAMVCHIIMIAASAFGGLVTNAFGYRVMFIWDFAITIVALLMLAVVFSEWKRFGGKNYQAPNVD